MSRDPDAGLLDVRGDGHGGREVAMPTTGGWLGAGCLQATNTAGRREPGGEEGEEGWAGDGEGGVSQRMPADDGAVPVRRFGREGGGVVDLRSSGGETGGEGGDAGGLLQVGLAVVGRR